MVKNIALLIGINYTDCSENIQLKGCSSDIFRMKTLLESHVPRIETELYTDDKESNTYSQLNKYGTSRKGIIENMTAFAKKSNYHKSDVAVIYYSGHGSNAKNRNRKKDNEIDGMDECIVPSDYNVSGFIRDDFINKILKTFYPGTKVVFICDACHSGSICDLPMQWNGYTTKNIIKKDDRVPNIVSISGCMDDQKSLELFNANGQKLYSGALTNCLIDIIEQNPLINTLDMYQELKNRLRNQTPALFSNYDLNDDKKLFK